MSCNLIKTFENTCQVNKDKIAIMYLKNNREVKVTYKQFYYDVINKMAELTKNNIVKGNKVLIFSPISYDLYVFLIACMYLGIISVFVDEWANKERVKYALNEIEPDYIAINKITKIIKFFLPQFKSLKKIIKIDNKRKGLFKVDKPIINEDDITLITLTTGSNGIPKAIQRTYRDLNNQFSMMKDNFNIVEANDIILSMLPIYVLSNISAGITTVIPNFNPSKFNSKKVNKLINRFKINSINGSPYFFINFNIDSNHPISKIYTGGAIISLKDAISIKDKFNNPLNIYIFGSTEAFLISITNLDDYISELNNNKICLGKIVNNIDIKINKNNMNEISVYGDIVLNKYNDSKRKGYCKTGDLGYIENQKIYYLGKKDFSFIINGTKIYNCQIEQSILNKFSDDILKCAIIKTDNKIWLAVQLTKKSQNNINSKLKDYLNNQYQLNEVKIQIFKKLPCDSRHNSKIDYYQLKKIFESK